MNNFKKALCALLAGLMVFATACGTKNDASSSSGDGKNVQKGMFVEKNITPPSAKIAGKINVLEDGTLVCYAENFKKKFTSKDEGDTWQEEEGPGKKDDAFENVRRHTVAPDGTMYAHAQSRQNSEEWSKQIIKVASDGAITLLNFKDLEEAKDPYIIDMQALSNNRLFLSWMSGMYNGPPDEQDEENEEGTQAPEDEAAAQAAPEGEAAAQAAPEGEAAAPAAPEGETAAQAAPEGEPAEQAAPEGEPAESGEEQGEEKDDGGGGMRFAGGGGSASVYDTESLEIVEDLASFSEGGEVIASNNMLYCATYDDKIKIYDVEQNKKLDDLEAKFDSAYDYMTKYDFDEQNSVYRINNKSLQMKKSSEEAQTLMNSSAYEFGNIEKMIEDFKMLNDKTFLVVLNAAATEEGENEVFKYTYDENAQQSGEVLKVWSLVENSAVRGAISLFRKENPDVIVDYEVAINESDPLKTSDALKELNTKILAGEGPDVLVLDDCPAESYANKGMLADLSESIDTSGVFENINKAFVNDGKQFLLPVRMKMPLIMGEKGEVEKLDDFDKLIETMTSGEAPASMGEHGEMSFEALNEAKRPNFEFQDIDEMLQLLWNSAAAEVYKNGEINKEALLKLLQSSKEVSQKQGYKNDESAMSMGGAMMVGIGSGTATMTGSSLNYSVGRAKFGISEISSVLSLLYTQEKTKTDIQPLAGMGGATWQPMGLFAVSEASKKKEAAMKFLQVAIGDDAQASYAVDGVSVTKKGIDKQISEVNALMKKEGQTMGEEIPQIEFDFASLVQKMENVNLVDNVIVKAYLEAAKSFCYGELELEAAVSKIEQELQTYLAERK